MYIYIYLYIYIYVCTYIYIYKYTYTHIYIYIYIYIHTHTHTYNIHIYNYISDILISICSPAPRPAGTPPPRAQSGRRATGRPACTCRATRRARPTCPPRAAARGSAPGAVRKVSKVSKDSGEACVSVHGEYVNLKGCNTVCRTPAPLMTRSDTGAQGSPCNRRARRPCRPA